MTPTRALTITVTEGLYGRFVEMARKQGMTPAVYGKLLFEAAYSARCGMTGDRELDAAVAAIGVEKPAVEADAETEHLRQRLAAALDAAKKWKASAAEWEQDAKLETQQRDVKIAELRGEVGRLQLQAGKDAEAIKAHELTLKQAQDDITRLSDMLDATVAEHETKERDWKEALAGRAQAANFHRERADAAEQQVKDLRFELSEARLTVAELKARIATATMTQVSHPEPATSAAAGGGMEETAPAHGPDQSEAASSTMNTFTPDQSKRARAYHSYGMSVGDIAKAMKVDVASVKAALRSAA